MKNFLKNGGLVLAGSVLGVSGANAALPAAATTAFTDLQTDALSLVDLAWTAAIPITIAFIILRMFKRAASSAT
ncbi:major coat protein [Methylomonas methanica]|uniref:Phage coat protein n=1 Tax=Methylomonas methanica (strain DSM 25384 / MC09) TaxID=857087 RepID=G0A214_METMM|nr:major coat protein [Methylomonas methanica]AEG02557.1 hypothetical protein Metme_4206 [Methylomonas methanica MC09]